MRYGIVGSGALGGYYGALLARSGLDVHFLVHSDRKHILEHGLKIESKDGDFVIQTQNVYDDPQQMPTCDVIVIALKSTQNHLLKKILPPITKSNSIAVVLQNGLHVESECLPYFSPSRIFGGCCFLCSNKIGPGHIRHLDYGRIQMGQYHSNMDGNAATSDDKILKAIVSDFELANINIEAVENLMLARWKKLAWNIPFNGLSVVLNASTDLLMRDPHSRALVLSLMKEIQTCARSCNLELGDDHIELMMDYTDTMVPYDSSMRLDFLNRRPMEVEAIFGNPCREAIAHGFRPPQMETLYQQLSFLNERNILTSE